MNYEEQLKVIERFAEKEILRVSFGGETFMPSEHERQMIKQIEKKSCATVYHIVRSILPVWINGKLKRSDLTTYLLTVDCENLQRLIDGMPLEDFIGDNKDVYAFVEDKVFPNPNAYGEVHVEPTNETVFIPQHSNCWVINGSYTEQSKTYIEPCLIMDAEHLLPTDLRFSPNQDI